MVQEGTAGEIAHQRLVDRYILEVERVDVLRERHLGDRHLVLDRARLLLAELGRQEVADDALRLVLALHRRGDDLVIGGFHAVELERAHGVEDVGAVHHPAALLRLS